MLWTGPRRVDSASNTTVDGTGIHLYDNFAGFQANLASAITNGGNRPLSVTEFDNYSATSVSDQLNYMIQAVNQLESTPSVNYYSWFYARTSNPTASPYISLFTAQPGVLSALGTAYVNMPVHDPNVYYRPNGQLQAERYTTMSNESIGVSGDTVANSLADMTSTAANGKLNYDLYVAQAGLFSVDLRVEGAAGSITLLDGSTTLNTVSTTGGGYTDVYTQISLPAGYDSLTLQFQHSGQVINYLGLAAVPEPSGGCVLIAGIAALSRRRRGGR